MNRSTLICPAFAFAFGVLAYLTSRGPDGALGAFLCFFAVLGVAYVLVCVWVSPKSARVFAAHLVVFEIAVLVALGIRPELEEMGGLLYLFEPAAVVLIVLIAAVIWFVQEIAVGPSTANSRQRQSRAAPDQPSADG